MKCFAFLYLILGLIGCTKPSLDFEVNEVSGDLIFEVTSSGGVNGLLGCVVWEESANTVLWDARLNNYLNHSFKYGDQTKGFRQVTPENGAAPELPKDVKIYVLIEFQYDSIDSASGGSSLYAFICRSDGTIENLGLQEWVKPPK